MVFNVHQKVMLIAGMLLLAFLLFGCSSEGGDLPVPTSINNDSTPLDTQAAATPAEPTTAPTPTPPPRRLTICIAEEPETLFIYGGDSLAQRHVLQAIYDGPIDMLGYQHEPVILEKLPSLADGDALLEPVPAAPGDLVVNAVGQLVYLEPGEVVRPFGCLSADCEISWDGSPLELPQLSATFTLKPDLEWSDSTPLTAADSVFSYQVAVQCGADLGWCGGLGLADRNGFEMLPRTASYSAVDQRSVRWVGVPGFLDPAYQTNFFIPLPEHQLSQYTLQELFSTPEAARQPLGWGPYALQSWVPGETISLRANPTYFMAQEIEVKFDELLFRFVGQQAENINLLSDGVCDLLDQSASQFLFDADPGQITQLDADGLLGSHIAAGPVWEHVDFGIQPQAYDDGYQSGADRPDYFRNVITRQAFAFCMDRERLIEQVLNGLSSVPSSYLPEEHPLFNPDTMQYRYDSVTGGQLLQEAGWVDHDADPQTPRQATGIQGIIDGTPLVVSYLTSPALQRQEASKLLIESLAECGIQVNLDSGPAEEVYAPGPQGPIFGRRFDLAQFAWSASYQDACRLWTSEQVPGDPLLEEEDGSPVFPYGWGGANAAGFRDTAFDVACERALSTLPGQDGYVESHLEVQSIFADQLPVVPLYQHLGVVLSRPDICEFTFDPASYSEFWNLENFERGPGCP